ncbi:MAG: transglycosylase SLT domain-containing protein [Vicinamibacterales bacterium]
METAGTAHTKVLPSGELSLPGIRPTAAGTWARRVTAFILLMSAGLMAADRGMKSLERSLEASTPSVPSIDIIALLLQAEPVPITITAAWTKVAFIATPRSLRADHTLWRRMHFDDWDAVPLPLRNEGLDAMLNRYRSLLASPSTWDTMRPEDWDEVPQPVRALAFRHMAEYWSGHYGLGTEHGIPRGTMADTLSALIMSESWFDHRAVNVNRSGSRDVGVAQATDCTRERMVELHRAGLVEVLLTEDDYFDPWKSTRFVALWMGFLLDEVDGDLDAAVRAYNQGGVRALRGEGSGYLEATKRRLHHFIRNEGAAGAWSHLWERDRELTAASRPWLARTASESARD